MTWNALDTYVFSGLANGAVPAPTSYASPSTGQAWSDVHGGVWSIASGQLAGTCDTTDSSQYKRDFLLAGSSTDEANQRIVSQLTYASGNNNIDLFNAHRYQRTGNVGNCYLVSVNFGANGNSSLSLYSIQGSTNAATQIGSTVNSSGLTSGHSYAIDSNVIGVNPTAITATLTDLTTNTVVSTTTVSDSTANLQQSGAMALDMANNSGSAAAQTIYLTNLNTYSYTASTPTTVNLPQPNIFFPGQGWDLSTAGHAITNTPGNYLKANFTTGSAVAFSISLNTAGFGSVADTEKPFLTWSIDGAAPQSSQMTSANTSNSLFQLAGSLAAGTHSLQIWVRSAGAFTNRWNPSANRNFVDITGFVIGAGTLAFYPVTTLPNLCEFFGDSMTEGSGTEGFIQSSNTPSYALNGDATHSYVPHLASALNAEYSSAAYGGQGWTTAAADGATPGLSTSWNYLYSGKARSFAGLTHVFVNMGTNGNTSGPAGTVSTFLTGLRAALTMAGSSAKIILFVPWSGAARSGLVADFTTYQGSVTSSTLDEITYYKGPADTNCVLIDLNSPVGLPVPAATNSAGSLYSYDTTHLSAYGNQRIIAVAARAVQGAFTATATSGRSFSFS